MLTKQRLLDEYESALAATQTWAKDEKLRRFMSNVAGTIGMSTEWIVQNESMGYEPTVMWNHDSDIVRGIWKAAGLKVKTYSLKALRALPVEG